MNVQRVDCAVCVCVNLKLTVFSKCEAKHAARREVFYAAGFRKGIGGMRVPHGELALPGRLGEG